eukprot:7005259-Prymnesium_polylepis.1
MLSTTTPVPSISVFNLNRKCAGADEPLPRSDWNLPTAVEPLLPDSACVYVHTPWLPETRWHFAPPLASHWLSLASVLHISAQ